MFHPQYTYINKDVTDFNARPLLRDIFKEGELVYELPTLEEIKEYSKLHLDSLWEEYKRDLNPQDYPVDLSQKCYDNKMKIIKEVRESINQKLEK